MSPIYIGNKKIVDINFDNSFANKIYIGEDLVFQKASINTSQYIFNIDTNLGNNTSFALPLVYGYEYDFIVDWGDGITNHITTWNDINKNHTYSSHEEYVITITGLVEGFNQFNVESRNKITSAEFDSDGDLTFIDSLFKDCINLTSFTTLNDDWCKSLTSMNAMFYNCSQLTTLDVSNWNTQSVTNMSNMFTNSPAIAHNYDDVLNNWANLPSLKTNVYFHAGTAKYSSLGQASRSYIINTYRWTITDGGMV